MKKNFYRVSDPGTLAKVCALRVLLVFANVINSTQYSRYEGDRIQCPWGPATGPSGWSAHPTHEDIAQGHPGLCGPRTQIRDISVSFCGTLQSGWLGFHVEVAGTQANTKMVTFVTKKSFQGNLRTVWSTNSTTRYEHFLWQNTLIA